MIDVSTIIHDPDFEQPFKIIRVSGSFTDGVWDATEAAPVDVKGIVLPASKDEIKVLPEGERLNASISIYAEVELTLGDQQNKQSDIIQYAGAFYRVQWTRYYAQCNLWYAIATRFQRAQP